MIPEEEHEILVLTFFQAFTFGSAGEVGTGYLLLCQGLAQAQAQDTRWAPALQSQWVRILGWYRQRFPMD